eukprot:TRINITY_DN11359_c0_g1_i1.p1 TRINITY_DN11359_c0_g1~~TRINITY_DN11359_c0_g1_i1.p1  ORF type:complete len:406 (+),score=95.50 TRINITY_DN11359_c0_g1_i1:234-1451(+)
MMINLVSFSPSSSSRNKLGNRLFNPIQFNRNVNQSSMLLHKWNHIRFSFHSSSPSVSLHESSIDQSINSSSLSNSSFASITPSYLGIPLEKEENHFIPLLGGSPHTNKGETNTFVRKIKACISLSKPRLSSLVLLSTLASFFMARPEEALSLKSLYCCVGTSLSIASANAFNQLIEIERDSKMSRTNDRTLPSAQITPKGAAIFAILCGIGGVGLLAWGVNTLTSVLALGNIILYAGVYTPLKVIHPINTWVGAIVGSVPLLMGWSGATGSIDDLAPWALASIQYIWQIPHFLSLSWKLRSDYEKGGYKMLVNVNPESTGFQCLLWSILLLPTGALCSYTGMVDWWFTLTSFPLNASMVYYSALFYKDNTTFNSNSLFKCSLFHSLAMFILMCGHKSVSLWNPKQ